MIEREHAALMEEQTKSVEPEPTPEERLEDMRRIQTKLTDPTGQWVRDAEEALAQSVASEDAPQEEEQVAT